jgi:uncharacterized surface protein with fasciclin (FAS1) repeats
MFLAVSTLLSIVYGNCIGSYQDQNQQQGAWNGSLLDNVNNDFRLRGVSLFLRTYCGQAAQRALNNRTANMTVFLPSDKALAKYLDLNLTMGAASFNCSTQGRNASSIASFCDPNVWPLQFKNVTVQEFSPCSPLVMRYHIVPDQRLNLTQTQNQTSSSSSSMSPSFIGLQRGGQQQQSNPTNLNTLNVTVLHTGLNDTRFVILPNNQSQVLILNQTNNGDYYLNHGFWPPAKILVNETVHGVNGIIYLVDELLLPPMNVSRTLEGANLTAFMSSVNQSQQMLKNLTQMQGVTIFAPSDSVIQGGSQTFNASAYIIPDVVLYNNGTMNNTTNLTALDGSSHQVSFGGTGNYSMKFGSANVIQSNILMSNGVVHIIESLDQSQQQGEGGQGAGIGRIFKKHHI